MDVHQLIQSIDTSPANSVPPLDTSLIIDELAAGSLAQVAGLLQGDHLLRIQEQPASQIDRWQVLIDHNSVSYLIYRPSTHTLIRLTTGAAPLGIHLSKSNDTVLADYRRAVDSADHKDLYPIWNREQADALKRICLEAINPWKMRVLELLNRLHYSPEYLFYGAALYDLGDRKAGMKIITAFSITQSQAHTQEQSAVVDYYYARELLQHGSKQRAVEYMSNAFSRWHHPRIQRELSLLTGKHHEFRRDWPGHDIELDYALEQVEFGSGAVNLGETLAAMRDDQFLIICVLGGYRVNRFYNAFMQRYLVYKKCFPDQIHDLHVITSNPDQENHPSYFLQEQQVVARLGPIKLLDDPSWSVLEYLEPHGSPTIYVINNKRKVLHEGDLDEFDVWALLGDQVHEPSEIPEAARS